MIKSLGQPTHQRHLFSCGIDAIAELSGFCVLGKYLTSIFTHTVLPSLIIVTGSLST
jgi:hypothetical protein